MAVGQEPQAWQTETLGTGIRIGRDCRHVMPCIPPISGANKQRAGLLELPLLPAIGIVGRSLVTFKPAPHAGQQIAIGRLDDRLLQERARNRHPILVGPCCHLRDVNQCAFWTRVACNVIA